MSSADRPPRIFISGNSEEFGHFRQVATEAVLRKGWTPVAQDHFATQHGSLPQLLKNLVASCDAVICLVGIRFGHAPRQAPGQGKVRSYTQMEYDFARAAKKPVYLMFGKDLPEGPEQSAEQAELQRAFIEEIKQTNDIREVFRNDDELRLRILGISTPPLSRRRSAALPLAGVGLALVLGAGILASKPKSGGNLPTDPGVAKTASEDAKDDDGRTAEKKEGPGAPPSRTMTNSLGMQFLPLGETASGAIIYLSRWETRIGDWQAFGADTGSPYDPPQGTSKLHPVSRVTLSKMVAFCEWLTAREASAGNIPPGAKYRLPTVNEWRMAAGLAPDTAGPFYPWGSASDPASVPAVANFSGRESAIGNTALPDDNFTKTAPVGSFPAFSSGGFQDLAGNVGEVCTIPGLRPMICGGDWQDMDFERMNLASPREYNPVDDVSETVGFRCALEIPKVSGL